MKIFDSIKINKPKSNVFDLSHERKMSMNMGDLVPCMVQEVIPGDKFRVNMEHMIRLQPLQSPMMHRVNVFTHFFFVPNRIIWNEFEDFITGGEDGKANPVFPRIKHAAGSIGTTEFESGKLSDYLGLPVNNGITAQSRIDVSALPFRAYQTIYNEYYRDQNLQDKILVSKSSGAQSITDCQELVKMRSRAWEKDYFTSALPFAQKGEQLTIPLSADNAPLRAGSDQVRVGTKRDGSNFDIQISNSNSEGQNLQTDLTDVTGSTINELRQAFSIQKWLEKNARGGSRYIEQIFMHFGIKSSDARLQRPEYLGGGKNPVVISEVLQHSGSQDGVNDPLGTMGGHGISVGTSNQFSRKFEEHGYVIGIMSVLPRTSYQNGLPRHFQKYDKFDYYWNDFAHLGEQPVFNNELYNSFEQGKEAENKGTFGYQPRYSEYRFQNDTVHGEMATTLDHWAMTRKFPDLPALNEDFISAKSSKEVMHRPFSVTDPTVHKLIVQTYVNFQAIRPVAKHGTPSGI